MNKKIKSLVLAAVMGLSLTTVAVVPATGKRPLLQGLQKR